MVKIFFEGSDALKEEFKKGLGDGYNFVDSCSDAECIFVEINDVSDAGKIGFLKGKPVFPVVLSPDIDIIKQIIPYKVSGIFTAPVKFENVIAKLSAIPARSQNIIESETLKAKIYARAESLPPLPDVARQLILMTADQNTGFARIVEKVKTDQSIAGKILKIVNSPFYGLRSEIYSIERAAVFIGLSAIKNIAISLSTSDYFRKNFTLYGKTGKELWNHSFLTAVLCEEMGKLSGENFNSEILYLTGLMHDFGKIVLVDFIVKQVNSTDDEKQQTGFDHTEVAEFILKRWNISKNIIGWIKNHHAFPTVSDESAILYYCNILEHNLNSDISTSDEVIMNILEAMSEILHTSVETVLKKVNKFSEFKKSGLPDD